MRGEAKQGHDDRRPARAAGDALTVTARTYHTEYGQAHAEGETYTVTDRALRGNASRDRIRLDRG